VHVKQTAAHDFFGDFFFAPHWYSSNFITSIMYLLSLRIMFTFLAYHVYFPCDGDAGQFYLNNQAQDIFLKRVFVSIMI